MYSGVIYLLLGIDSYLQVCYYGVSSNENKKSHPVLLTLNGSTHSQKEMAFHEHATVYTTH